MIIDEHGRREPGRLAHLAAWGVSHLNQGFAAIGRLFGWMLILGSGLLILLLLLSFYLGFYRNDRILIFFPGLAEEVTLKQLLSEPERYDDRWVRVKGMPIEAASSGFTAKLVSAEYEGEAPEPGEFIRIKNHAGKRTRCVKYFNDLSTPASVHT